MNHICISIQAIYTKPYAVSPELSVVGDPDAEQVLVPVTETVPLPATLTPGAVPLSPAPGVTQSAGGNIWRICYVRQGGTSTHKLYSVSQQTLTAALAKK